MNKIALLFIIFASFFLTTCSSTTNKDNLQKKEFNIEKEDSKKSPRAYLPYKKWVLAKSGLNVRKHPNSKSEKIGSVPFASEVVVLEDTDEYIDIVDPDSRLLVSGAWVFIKWRNIQGWIFDGYLGEYDTTQKIKYHEIIYSFIKNPFLKEITFKDNLRESVIKYFGNPKIFKTEKIENRHVPGTYDNQYILIYNGLSFTIYHVTYDNKQILAELEINDDKYKYRYSVNFKMKKEDIKNIFGDPMSKDDISYDYNTNLTSRLSIPTAVEYIKFYFDRFNKLIKIKINHYNG